jgi:hypothetical protein
MFPVFRSALRFLTVSIFCIISSIYASSQIIRYDNWQSYSSMFDVQAIEVDGFGNYWVGTNGGMYIYDPAEDTFDYFRGPDDLISNEVTSLKWNPENNTMYVGHSNGGLNTIFFDGQRVTDNISNSDITNADISSPAIEGIEYEGERVYVVGTFGMATYLPGTNIFLEDTKKFTTLPVGTGATDITKINNILYVSTERGVVRTTIDESLADPNKWELLLSPAPIDQSFFELEKLGGGIYCTNGTELFIVEQDSLVAIEDTLVNEVNSITASSEGLFTLVDSGIKDISADSIISVYNFQPNLIEYYDNKILIGTRRNSLIEYDLSTGDTTYITPLTPQANFVKKIYIDDTNGDVYYTTGSNGAAGTQRLTEDGWIVYNGRTVDGLPTNESEDVHRIGDDIFISYFGSGVYKVDANNGQITKHFTTDNTSLTPFDNGIYITDLEEDNEGVLWGVVAGFETSGTLLASYDPDTDNWNGIVNEATNDRWNNSVEIDDFGNKWLGGHLDNSQGLIYYNENPSQNSPAWGNLSRSLNPQLLSNIHNDMEMDQNGNLWLATSNGLTVLINPGSVANGNEPIFVEKPEFSGLAINSLAVDAVNNMFVGTFQGISIYGPDGEEIIATINTDNSELLSNAITDIEIAESGTIYIGTENGLYSVEGSLVKPNGSYDISTYPQPFIPRTHEGLTIEGLAPDTDVRIMTPDGIFINSFNTTSGTYIWNGRDANNRMIEPGVYLIVATSASTESSSVHKFAVIGR